MPFFPDEITHGQKYNDENYEYKSVYLPKKIFQQMIKNTLLSEVECSQLGIIHSKGWEHYLIFKNEPNVLQFRRPLGTDPSTGITPIHIVEKIKEFQKKREQETKEYEEYLDNNYDTEELKSFYIAFKEKI